MYIFKGRLHATRDVNENKYWNVLQNSYSFTQKRPYFRFRRLIDVLVSVVLLIVLMPIMGGIAMLVLVDLGRPFLFIQVRPGRYMRPFKLYKFRTMRDAYAGCSDSDHRRISPFGGLLRRTRLDELPQLYNVLIGDMALIGPRPLLPRDLPEGLVGTERAVLPPGITGWAQVHGGQKLSVMEKVALDRWYTCCASLAVDIRIILLTIRTMVEGEKINRREVERASCMIQIASHAPQLHEALIPSDSLIT